MKIDRTIATALIALPFFVGTGSANATTWNIDAHHSEVGFKVRHMMISNVRGTFGTLEGTVEYDRASPEKAVVDVTIQTGSINTGQEKRDEHLRNADFFDVENHPVTTFRSKSVEKSSGGLRVRGDLTLRGVTKEVVLEVEGPSKEITDPWGHVKLGAAATAKINRTDFGLSYNKALEGGGVVIGEEVTITLDIELNRASD